jgi:hypothetical protein
VSSLSYALVTPSFRLDVERCRLLTDSVERWVVPGVRHYLVVDRRDLPMFRSMASARTEIVVVEDVIPKWLFRMPVTRKFWFSLRTRPLRNWILQQVVKLSIPSFVAEDVLLYADSDVFFIAPYDPASLQRDGTVPLFVETGQRGLIRSNDQWHDAAATLLGLPAAGSYDTNYIGNLITWRRQNVLALRRRIEDVAGKDWQLALAPLNAFSEYILYGMFAQRVLGERSQHWDDSVLRTLNYWGTEALTRDALQALSCRRQPFHHSVMISAKSHTPVAEIRSVFFTG